MTSTQWKRILLSTVFFATCGNVNAAIPFGGLVTFEETPKGYNSISYDVTNLSGQVVTMFGISATLLSGFDSGSAYTFKQNWLAFAATKAAWNSSATSLGVLPNGLPIAFDLARGVPGTESFRSFESFFGNSDDVAGLYWLNPAYSVLYGLRSGSIDSNLFFMSPVRPSSEIVAYSTASNGSYVQVYSSLQSVPEPGTWTMLLAGLALILGFAKPRARGLA